MFMKVPEESWLKKTNQLWKVWLFCLCGISLFGFALLDQVESIDRVAVRAATLFAFILSILSVTVLVRCPRCGKRPLNRVMLDINRGRSRKNILSFEQCPHCGYDGK